MLINGIASYQRIDQVRALLGRVAERWTVIENSGEAAQKDSRPPFRIYTVQIHEYEHLGFKGDLKLTFFNNRLMKTTFFPTDLPGYVAHASATTPGLAQGKAVHLSPFTQVRIGTDYQNRRYVSWEDVRLAEEMSLWIKRYS